MFGKNNAPVSAGAHPQRLNMDKLDKSKPYATVHGHGEKHKYEQGGKKYDGQGNPIMSPDEIRRHNQKKMSRVRY